MAARGTKVLVAAAFSPANLVALGLGLLAAAGVGSLLFAPLAALVGLLALGHYGARVLALAADPVFARAALTAGDLGASSLRGSRKLAVLERFGKLPPGTLERVKRLTALGDEVERRLDEGAGGVYDGALAALAPQVRQALDEAVELAGRAARHPAAEAGPGRADARIDRILEILESMKADLLTMDPGNEALPGEGVVLRLEDLSGEVRILKESLDELGDSTG